MKTLRKIKLIEQMEHSECGLACVAMILNYYKLKINLSKLREDYGVPIGGYNLLQLKEILTDFNIDSKGVTIKELNNLDKKYFPFIAFWKNKHFIIVEKIKKTKVLIIDPSLGKKWISKNEFIDSFSKIALFCIPNKHFKPIKNVEKINFFISLFTGQKKLIFLLILISLAIQIVGIGVPILIQNIIDKFIYYNRIDLNILGFLIISIILGFYILNVSRTLIISKVHIIFDENLMSKVFKHLLQLPYNFFTNRSHGELIYRMNSNLYIRQILSERIISIFIDIILFFIYLGIMLKYSITLSLLVLLIGIIIVIISLINSNKIKSINEVEIIHSTKIQTILNESINGILTIKSLGGEENIFNNWFKEFSYQLQCMRLKGKYNAFLSNIPYTIQMILPLIILWNGAYYIEYNHMTIGTLIAFNTIAAYFINPILSLTNSYSDLIILKLYINKLYDIISSNPEKYTDNKIQIKSGNINIKNVYFKYNKFAQNVLTNINLYIKSGEKVAIVGKSGSGKSTLLKLLIGVYSCNSGKVFIDNIDIQKTNLQNYRSNLGVVLQEPQIFNGTIKENILFGRTLSNNAIFKAINKANLTNFIENLPLGIETIISEDGINLSGGQRQRISLARALLNNPKIIYMDEPTSSLDNEAEMDIINNIFNIDSTCIIICHRFYNIENFDKIVVMDNGKIVDIGSHLELKSRCTLYNNMYEIKNTTVNK